MDKNKFIDEILAEWAMRSPDGLVGGHDTPENMAVLNEILAEKMTPEEKEAKAKAKEALRISREEEKKKRKEEEERKKNLPATVPEEALKVDYFKDKKKDGRTLSMTKNNPYYPDNIPFELVKSGKADMSIEGLRLHLGDKIEGKGFTESHIDLILSAIQKYQPKGKKKFIEYYNKCDIYEAIKVFEEYPEIVSAIEGGKKTLLGRGELTFVFLLKGAKTGGQGVDILLVEGLGSVEVKEVTKKELKVQISAATFGGWNRSDTKTAIDELATEVRHDKNFAAYLIDEVLLGKDKNGNSKYPAVDRNKRKLKSVSSTQIEKIKDFFEGTRTTEMHASTFYALEWIWQKLLSPFPKEENDSNTDTLGRAKISISVGDDTKSFKLTNPQKASETLRSVSAALNSNVKNVPVNLDVSAEMGDSLDKKSANEEYYYLARSLDFFKKRITKEFITREINQIAKTKYNGYLVIYGGKEGGGGNYKAIFADTNKSLLEFSSLGLAKINAFLKVNVPGLKPIPDEELRGVDNDPVD